MSNYNVHDIVNNKYTKKNTLVRFNNISKKDILENVTSSPSHLPIVYEQTHHPERDSKTEKISLTKSVHKKDEKIDDEGFSSFYTLDNPSKFFKNGYTDRFYLRSVSTLRKLPLLRDDNGVVNPARTPNTPPITHTETLSIVSNDQFDVSSGLYEEIPKSVESTVLSEILDGYHSEEAPTI